MLNSRIGGKSRWKLSSHRVGIGLILLSFLWGLYLIKIQLDERRNHSHYLKDRIIELSKQYVHALAKEKSLSVNTIDGQQSGKCDFHYYRLSILVLSVFRGSTLQRQVLSRAFRRTDWFFIEVFKLAFFVVLLITMFLSFSFLALRDHSIPLYTYRVQ